MENNKLEFKEKIIERLKKQADKLIARNMEVALNCAEEVKFKNLVNALDTTLSLIDKYDWQLKWNKYKEEDKNIVSVWEQDIYGNIRNNEKFVIEDDNKFEPSLLSPFIAKGSELTDFAVKMVKSPTSKDFVSDRGQGTTFAIALSAYLDACKIGDTKVTVISKCNPSYVAEILWLEIISKGIVDRNNIAYLSTSRNNPIVELTNGSVISFVNHHNIAGLKCDVVYIDGDVEFEIKNKREDCKIVKAIQNDNSNDNLNNKRLKLNKVY